MPTRPSKTILAEYSYRPRFLPTLLVVIFFTLTGLFLTFNAQGSAGVLDWVFAALSWGFVAAGVLAGLLGIVRPQRIATTEGGLIIPAGRWTKSERFIRLDEVLHVRIDEVAGQRLLRIGHHDGDLTLSDSMLPDRKALEAIAAHLRSHPGPALGAYASASPSASPSAATAGPAADHTGGLSIWHILLLKIAALLSFCGGPLYVTDLLEPTLGNPQAFAVGFVPVALMLFGTFSLAEDVLSGFPKLLVRLGAASALVLVAESVFASWRILAGETRADAVLILLGCIVSFITASFYLRAWWRRR